MFYAIALESLFSSSGSKSGVTERLSLRCSLLLNKPPGSFGLFALGEIETRREQMRDLYHVRSEIVHRGTSVVTAHQLRQISEITKQAILVALEESPFREMSSETEFEDWLDKQAAVHEYVLQSQQFRRKEFLQVHEALQTRQQAIKRELLSTFCTLMQTVRNDLVSDLCALLQEKAKNTL